PTHGCRVPYTTLFPSLNQAASNGSSCRRRASSGERNPYRSMSHERLYLSLHLRSATRSSSTVVKCCTHSSCSLRVRIIRSEQPFPSGDRTKEGLDRMPRNFSLRWKTRLTYWEPLSWRRDSPSATPLSYAP